MKIRHRRKRRNLAGLVARVRASTARATAALDAALAYCQGDAMRTVGRPLPPRAASADAELADTPEKVGKAVLVMAIGETLRRQKWPERSAAELLGWPDLPRILSGHFRDVSETSLREPLATIRAVGPRPEDGEPVGPDDLPRFGHPDKPP